MQAHTTLSHSEVREQLSELSQRIVHEGEEVHYGHRRRDEITMIASDRLAEIKRLAQRAVAMEVGAVTGRRSDPWAGLKQAVRRGALPSASASAARRLPPGFDPEAQGDETTELTWDEMVRRGAAAAPRTEFVRRTRGTRG